VEIRKDMAASHDHPIGEVHIFCGRTSDTLLAKPAVCGRRCVAPVPAPEGSAPPCRGRTSDTLPVGRASARLGVVGLKPDLPPPEGSAPPCRGRTSDTLLAKPAVCGRRCIAPVPAPEGSAPPCRGRTSDTLPVGRASARLGVVGLKPDLPPPEGSAPPCHGRRLVLLRVFRVSA